MLLSAIDVNGMGPGSHVNIFVADQAISPAASTSFTRYLSWMTDECFKCRVQKKLQKRLLPAPIIVRMQGLEPWTYGLKVRCSTN